MTIFKILGIFAVVVFSGAVVVSVYLHQKTQGNPLQAQFLSGKVPSILPDGFYRGSVQLGKTAWQGKQFNRYQKTGVNIVKKGTENKNVYPFKMYPGMGSVDGDLKVLKIDYNLPQNPFWLRLVVDEVVETAPNHFLGKLVVRIGPRVSFALGYFELDKNPVK